MGFVTKLFLQCVRLNGLINHTVGKRKPWSLCVAVCFLFSLETLLASAAIAESTNVENQIIKEVSGKKWEQLRRPSSGYIVGRFSFEGSFEFPEGYDKAGLPLLQQIADGKFELAQPTQRGDALEDIPAYLKDKPVCSSAPIRYWNGISEIPTAQYEHLKSRKSSDITPYLPGAARPLDYEAQLGPNLEVIATATSNFELYDFDAADDGSRLRVFRAENYAPTSSTSSSLRLEGSFAAYETPSCRFIGTLDYFTHCMDVRSNPARQPDAFSLARIIQIDRRPFVITVSRPDCNAETSPGRSTLYLWDITASGAAPIIYGFTGTEAK